MIAQEVVMDALTPKRAFALAFLGSSAVGLVFYFVSSFVPEEHHGVLSFSFAAILWTVCASVAIQRPPFVNLASIAVGLSWGFIIVLSILVSVQNGRISVAWGPFGLALIGIPACTLVSTSLFWAIGKRMLTPLSLSVISLGFIALIIGSRLGVIPFQYKGKQAPAGEYDIAAVEVVVDPNPAKLEDPIIISYTIKNVGLHEIPEGTYEVELFVDGRKIGFDYAASGLGPGEDNSYSYPPEKLTYPAGTHSYKLVVDPRGRLQETDESNNVLEGSFTISP